VVLPSINDYIRENCRPVFFEALLTYNYSLSQTRPKYPHHLSRPNDYVSIIDGIIRENDASVEILSIEIFVMESQGLNYCTFCILLLNVSETTVGERGV
jgi:hypothetical protein